MTNRRKQSVYNTTRHTSQKKTQNVRINCHNNKKKTRKNSKKTMFPRAILVLASMAVVLMAIIVVSDALIPDAPSLVLTVPAQTESVPTVQPEQTAFTPQAEVHAPVIQNNPVTADNPQPTQVPQVAESFEYLPVYHRANTTEKKIAITVDDCYQLNNLKTIVRTAYDNNAKLTLFPIGSNISKPGMAEFLKNCVFQLGFEIENHTWSHQRVFRLSEQEMAAEIWKQSQAVNQALGVNYQQHFFRLMGGDGSSDQRTHNYLEQLGYKGIADWSLSGSDADMNMIKNSLEPGKIYLFHTTDADTEKLKTFIPYAVSQGYQLVTMNELLGLEDNEISPLTQTTMPEPRAYTPDYRAHKKGDYAWIIVQMQNRLRELGYMNMDGPSTGYYGDQTANAVAAFQQANGISPTGTADSETQRLLAG